MWTLPAHRTSVGAIGKLNLADMEIFPDSDSPEEFDK